MSTSPNRSFEHFWYKGAFWKLALAICCLLFAAFLGQKVPVLLAELGRDYQNEKEFYSTLQTLALLFVGVYANRAFYQRVTVAYVAGLIDHVRSRCYGDWLFNHDIQTDTKSGSDRYPMGEVIARIMSDTESFRELVTSGTLGIFIDIFFVISCLVSFIFLNTFAGFSLLGVEFVAAALLLWAGKYMRAAFMGVRNSQGRVYQTLANTIGGVAQMWYINHGGYAVKKGKKGF